MRCRKCSCTPGWRSPPRLHIASASPVAAGPGRRAPARARRPRRRRSRRRCRPSACGHSRGGRACTVKSEEASPILAEQMYDSEVQLAADRLELIDEAVDSIQSDGSAGRYRAPAKPSHWSYRTTRIESPASSASRSSATLRRPPGRRGDRRATRDRPRIPRSGCDDRHPSIVSIPSLVSLDALARIGPADRQTRDHAYIVSSDECRTMILDGRRAGGPAANSALAVLCAEVREGSTGRDHILAEKASGNQEIILMRRLERDGVT